MQRKISWNNPILKKKFMEFIDKKFEINTYLPILKLLWQP